MFQHKRGCSITKDGYRFCICTNRFSYGAAYVCLTNCVTCNRGLRHKKCHNKVTKHIVSNFFQKVRVDQRKSTS